jgi:sulfatase maturation enzyme AslB (radical SAM superfamily)
MTKAILMKKLETAIDEATRQRLYGNVEIEFRAGEPTFLRTLKQEKLDVETENRSRDRNYNG